MSLSVSSAINKGIFKTSPSSFRFSSENLSLSLISSANSSLI